MTSQTTLTIFLLAYLQHAIFSAMVPSSSSDVGLNTVEMIENHGYVCENHYITTEDGYILTFQRIPHGKNNNGSGKKPAVFLMHGLTSSSADYVNMGPNRSLSYILADLGYDVWLGNARGNSWSRNHTTLDIEKDAEEFFDFSWHQIGYYDVAAGIDYILGINGDESLYYVGHSQGTTSLMVLLSTRSEYNKKVKIASLMGPASFMDHQSVTYLQVLSKHIYEIEKMLKKYNIYEIPYIEAIRKIALTFCTDPATAGICSHIFGHGGDENKSLAEKDMLPVVFTNYPSSASLKQFFHYGQLIRNGGFTQYDFGGDKNKEIYGTETPPTYDLSKITSPVAVYYGKSDTLVNFLDAETLIKNLPNVADDYLVPDDLFNHVDFLFAEDVVDLVYVELIKVMQRY